MATTAEGRRLTETHRILQRRLAALTVAQMRQLWRLLDVENLEGTAEDWLTAALAVIERNHNASAALASRYFLQFRQAEVGDTDIQLPVAPALNREQATTSLTVTGIARAAEGKAAVDTAAAAAVRLALNGGRGMIMEAVEADPVALGWIRVTDGDPCAFCALLSSRGPAYKSQATASFQAHDSCACTAEPVYDRNTEWPGRAREFRDLYNRAAKNSGFDPVYAFRRAYEGRIPVDE